MPEVNETLSNGMICINDGTSCCAVTKAVEVRNCYGDYSVYKLSYLDANDQAHCIGRLLMRLTKHIA